MVPDQIGEHKPISHEVKKHNKEWGSERRRAAAREARESAAANAARGKLKQVAAARSYLAIAAWNAAAAYIAELPLAQQELYYLVEENDQNRSELLQYLTKPGQKARDLWTPLITGVGTSEAPPKRRRASTGRKQNGNSQA
jgi:hypothetical protein